MSDQVQCPRCDEQFPDEDAVRDHLGRRHMSVASAAVWGRDLIVGQGMITDALMSEDPEVRREARELQTIEHLAKIRAGVNFVVAVLLLAVVAGVAFALLAAMQAGDSDTYGGF